MYTDLFLIVSIAAAVLAFGLAAMLCRLVARIPVSSESVSRVSELIRRGANVFLRREYRVIAVFTLCAGAVIFIFLPSPVWYGSVAENAAMSAAYLLGAVLSALAGKAGIFAATLANARAAEAACRGEREAFRCSFRGGAVMGLAVTGASLFGLAVLYRLTDDSSVLLGFSFGASSVALFAKAGGGVFTKTADISADLVGKVELGIPEDDPRNPAVIADNVGDNVGDVAGMGADLFESHVAASAAALVTAASVCSGEYTGAVFCFSACGLLASVLGIAFASLVPRGSPTASLNRGTYSSTALFLIFSGISAAVFSIPWRLFAAAGAGLLVGVLIGIATDRFTNDAHSPVRKTAASGKNGAAFTVLSGSAYGFASVLPAMAGIGAAAAAACFLCAPLGAGGELLGVAVAAVGMLSVVATVISNDAYGPIADNARGLAEMCSLGDNALRITDRLDSAGNTVKAVTKGFAIGAAGLTVISLLGAFMAEVNAAAGHSLLTGFDILNPLVFAGLLCGAAVPALFSAMLILGVSRNAGRMVTEIHRQFREITGLRDGTVAPDYGRCIDIAASGALRELIPAGLAAILITLAVGFIGGVNALGGFITGNIVSGLLLALFMSNSGGLWDNAKKFIEAGAHGGKNSPAHRAAVTGDTVGDPFKDTAGPSINTQITVVTLAASLCAELFINISVF